MTSAVVIPVMVEIGEETMDELRCVSIIAFPIFLGIGGLLFWLWRNPEIKNFKQLVARLGGVSVKPSDVVAQGKIAKSDAIGLGAPMEERLQVVDARQMIELDGKEFTVRSSVTWQEMWQEREGVKTSPFVPKPKGIGLKMLGLDGDMFIIKMRTREGGKPIWLKSKKVLGKKLMTFFAGTDAVPGPARILRMNKQETPVPFNFPGSGGLPSGVWSAVDIGRLNVAEMTGQSDIVHPGDNFPFVMCREGKEEDGYSAGWVVYLDQRPELAEGEGGLFVCVEFRPSQEIQTLL